MSAAPDLIEPFVGWKGLHANMDGQLFSPQERKGDVWPASAPLEAICINNKKHEPPVTGCGCGIYAVKTFEDLKNNGYNWSASYSHPERGDCIAVVAEVKLWGAVRKGRIGYRAQYAYPEKIYLPGWRMKGYAQAIKDRYGCRIGIIDRFTGRRI